MNIKSESEIKPGHEAENHTLKNDGQQESNRLIMNFKTIKELVLPGSWRRGYGYYQNPGQIQEIGLNDKGVIAKVKGNYKSHYTTQLVFTPDTITPQCDCPLEEPWCKHAVSVALISVQKHLWEKFWKLSYKEIETCAPLDSMLDYDGRYRVTIDFQHMPKYLGVMLEDRVQGEPVIRIDAILRDVIQQQKAKQLELNNTEKQELKLMQFLYQNAKQEGKSPWFRVQPKHVAEFVEHLQGVEEICNSENNYRLRFVNTPLKLSLSVNASMAGNVMVSLHWNLENKDIFPIDEITLFSREIPWGVYQDKIYPLANTFRNLPNHLTKSAFYDLRNADGGKFVFDELPKLRNLVEVEKGEIIDKAFVQQEPPKRIVSLKKQGAEMIIAELDFSYEGTRLPYSKSHDAPYVTVTKKDTDTIYWLKRDVKLEEECYQHLLSKSVQPLQSNMVVAEGDDAVDFYNIDCKTLETEGWTIEPLEGIAESFKISDELLKIKGHLDFPENSIDQFQMKVGCGLGDELIDIETVQNFLVQGRKYVDIPGRGKVEIPLASMLHFTKTLNYFDREQPDPDTHLIKTYQAGLLSELLDQGVEFTMSDEFKKFWDLVTSFSELEEVLVPSSVRAELRQYQKQGYNWLWFLYTYGLNGILADDMGLGKTLQALVVLQKAKDDEGRQPTLIIAPTSVVFNWVKEAEKFTPDLKILDLSGADRHKHLKDIEEYDVVVTSYALVRRDYKILRQFTFRYVILDESQNIKNIESQTAKAVKALKAQHRLALSGTPMENRLVELWSIYDFLTPGFLLELDEFRYRYINPIEERGSQDVGRRLRKLISPFILRRLKRDVAKDLPDKIENLLYCDLLPEQKDLYMDVLERTREEILAKMGDPTAGVNQASVLSALLRLRQVCCHPKLMASYMEEARGVASGKLNALKEMVTEVIDEGHRILIFSQFVEMLDIIREWLRKEDIKHEYLTGETKNRQAAVENFNNKDDIPVFLISLKAGGTGLNLTGADYVIHYDPWWNPAVEDQATDRAHRIGQTKKVIVYRFITRGTVEEKIMKLQDRKRDLVDSIISVDRQLGKTFSLTDLKEILSPEF